MTTTTPSKAPNAACEMHRNRVDTAVFSFIEKHGPINYHFVLGAADVPFDNREIRGSIRRMQRGGRIEVQHWTEKRETKAATKKEPAEHKNVACQGLALKKSAAA